MLRGATLVENSRVNRSLHLPERTGSAPQPVGRPAIRRRVQQPPIGSVLLGAGMVLAVLAGGCAGRGAVVSFQYDRPGRFQLPATVGRVAFADLVGTTDRDKAWGRSVSDKLAGLATAEPLDGRRWEVVRLAGVQPLNEVRKGQSMPASLPVESLGKGAQADAMVVGWANVMVRDEQVAVAPSALPLGPARLTVLRRYAAGTVELHMVETATSKVLASLRITEQFDSLANPKAPSAASRPAEPGAAEPASVDEVLNDLAERAAGQFLVAFSPRHVTVSQELKVSTSNRVQAGNRAAAGGEYAKALRRYEDALGAHPLDDAALFNAALMCEALGRFDEAAKYADRAAVLKSDKDYVRLGQRARGELPE